MKNYRKAIMRISQRAGVIVLACVVSLSSPLNALAEGQSDAVGEPTGAPADTGAPQNTGAPADTGAPEGTGTPAEETGAPACTGAGCGQGANQGIDQGKEQGGQSAGDVGGVQDEAGNWSFPVGGQEQLRGGTQGTAQGTSQGENNGTDINANNSNTGANSENTIGVGSNSSSSTTASNTASDSSTVGAGATTGQNTASQNTGNAGIGTGNVGIGVTQIKNDNTAIVNGSAGVSVEGYNGDYEGDLQLAFGGLQSLIGNDGTSQSIVAVNDTTGSGSSNDIGVEARVEEVTEVQNDGVINNELNLSAITGQNETSQNTGSGSISTGDASIAATLVNLLNSTVINGALLIAVTDIFGNLTGDIYIPLLSGLASLLGGGSSTTVNAANETTGSDSSNTVDVNITDTERTDIVNNAEITTTVAANAITGQNETLANTGGGQIDTGDASVTASNISLANTTIEGGNWGLVIINALNTWIGLLIGENGQVQQLTQEETIREIEARNSNTGSESDNTVTVDSETSTVTTVSNDATIRNTVYADAITGQNTANRNTGVGDIDTGKASITATSVNIANTVVKDATLAIAVVNIFGNWVGDLIYDGSSLLASLFGSGSNNTVAVNGNNSGTGAGSVNSIDVTVNNEKSTNIENTAHVGTILNANVDTGNNRSNRNTSGADIETGRGFLGLHARNVANITAVSDSGHTSVILEGNNGSTGFDSTNRIHAHVNETRIVNIDNDASIRSDFMAEVNTGNNETNQNTVGGAIDTGVIDADVAVYNIVNKVLLALGPDVAFGFNGRSAQIALHEVVADIINAVTGSESENQNLLEVVRNTLISVLNDGAVSTVADLLFNTGGNEASSNTCGDGCIGAAVVDESVIVNSQKENGAQNIANGSGNGESEEAYSVETAAGDSAGDETVVSDEGDASSSADYGVSQGGRAVALASTKYEPEPIILPQSMHYKRENGYRTEEIYTTSDSTIGDIEDSEFPERDQDLAVLASTSGQHDVSSLPGNGLQLFIIGSILAAGGAALARKRFL